MEIVYTSGSDKRFIELCSELDNYFIELVGGEEQKKFDQYNTLEDIHDVVLILNNGQAVGCGSFKKYKDDTAEVKRVFVRKSARNKGFGKTIINELEKRAAEKGYKRLVLETGVILKAAQSMYKKLGFKVVENYGQYKGMIESVCMEKYMIE